MDFAIILLQNYLDYSPNILIADNATSISNGFTSVFDLDYRVNCWAHSVML
jgi:hypothetical protein